MGRTTRFGVSLESGLLVNFDRLIAQQGYNNRSEAIRDLIRAKLVSAEWQDGEGETVGILGLVYDHEAHDLTEKLNAIQHRHLHLIVASFHVHLDAHNCLEVVAMRGKGSVIRNVADQLISTKNVKHGDLLLTTTGRHIH